MGAAAGNSEARQRAIQRANPRTPSPGFHDRKQNSGRQRRTTLLVSSTQLAGGTVKRAAFEPGREWRTVNAIHRKDLPMPEKSLLIAIAKHEARRHRVCYASVRTLSSDAGCDEKTRRRVLNRLEKKYKLIRVPKLPAPTSP